eukprot:362970-Alexandrium_andersonii.AAC.1
MGDSLAKAASGTAAVVAEPAAPVTPVALPPVGENADKGAPAAGTGGERQAAVAIPCGSFQGACQAQAERKGVLVKTCVYEYVADGSQCMES